MARPQRDLEVLCAQFTPRWPLSSAAPKRLSCLLRFPRRRAMDVLVPDVLLAVISVFLAAFVGSTSDWGYQLIGDSLGAIWLVALAMAIVAAACLFRIGQAHWPLCPRPWRRGATARPPSERGDEKSVLHVYLFRAPSPSGSRRGGYARSD
jgi:hypothetical protein